MMRSCADKTGLPIHIYGPETHVTAIVPLALGLAKVDDFPEFDDPIHEKKMTSRKRKSPDGEEPVKEELKPQSADHDANHKVENFSASTQCVVYGLQNQAVQGMLDFDFMCKREKPSVRFTFSFFSSQSINFRHNQTHTIRLCILRCLP